MKRWLPLLPLVVVVALVVLFVGWSLKRDPQFKPDAMVGRPIPETVLPILGSDANVDLKTAGVGRPMIVNLFASWCAPCRIEHPKLMELKARGVTVVGVAYKDEPEATQAYLEALGDPYAMVLVDREGRAGLDLGVSGVPETFAVDALGRITAKFAGPLLDDTEIDRLVASTEAPARAPPTATRHAR